MLKIHDEYFSSLKQKEETGDTLLEVDFQQLRIENQQFLERIDNKNQDLLYVKLKAGKCHVSGMLFLFFIWLATFLGDIGPTTSRTSYCI